MVKATELRIGNLIMDDEGELSTVTGTAEGEIMTAGVWLPEDKFNNVPLPTAKDIFKMMGFTIVNRGGKILLVHIEKKYSSFYLEISHSGNYYYNGSGRGQNARLIQSVHNLQNLFFELYRTELLWNFRKL
jgi:hypothetical protein